MLFISPADDVGAGVGVNILYTNNRQHSIYFYLYSGEVRRVDPEPLTYFEISKPASFDFLSSSSEVMYFDMYEVGLTVFYRV